MPSLIHETMIEMVRQRPAAIADFLSGPMGLDVPTFRKAMFLSGELTEVTPTEYRADGVVAFYATEDARRPSLAVVFEAQRRRDRRKRLSWPVYVATAHARHDCPTALLVWCESRSVAEWAARPISTGDPGLLLTPMAMGPDRVPVITDPVVARKHPELAVLSALTYGPGRNPEPVLDAFTAVLDKFDPEHARLYAHLVATVLPVAARGILEKLMTSLKISEEEFGRTVLPRTYAKLTAEGMAVGKAEGLAAGKAEGKAEGLAAGKAEGKAGSLLTVLGARSIAVPDDVRQRITTCTDLEQLDTWIVRAATALRVDDLFA